MLSNENNFRHYYLKCGFTDLRRGLDGLMTIVQQYGEFDLKQKDSLFLFCGRRKDRLKAISWQGNGYILLYYRLEEEKFHWPRSGESFMEIDHSRFVLLINGFDIL